MSVSSGISTTRTFGPLQLDISMHTINVILLLIDAALNCLVTSHSYPLLFFPPRYPGSEKSNSDFRTFLFSPFRGSLCFGSPTSSCGQPSSWYSSGFSMPASPSGKVWEPHSPFLSIQYHQDSRLIPHSEFACLYDRWPYPFLDLSSRYAPIWYASLL